MRRTLKAAALVALLAAAALAADGRTSRTNTAITFDQKTTSKKRYELPVPAEGTRVRFQVKASVREGELKMVVRDPTGAVRHDVRLGGPKAKTTDYDVDTGEVRSPAGVWTVEVETREAVGRYEFSFTQNDH
ncbi:MAG TPA: hypothetical protein VF591_02030 [Pyrinomonadaceae bacterium]|jgi:hypothetical protein